MIGANLKDMSASDVVNTLLTDPTKFAGQVGDILLRAIDPVSYTHLDVYKRQVLSL